MFFVPIVIFAIIFFESHAMDMSKDQPKKKNVPIKQLFSSIVNYKYQETEELISKSPQLIDASAVYKSNFFSEEMTPVHVAAFVGNSVALKNMLGVSQKSVNALTSDQENAPLHLASNERVVQLLLENGATVSQCNKNKHTPLYEALYSYRHEGEPYFNVAYFLLKNSADINQGGRFGQTVLHKATEGNISNTYAHFLLANGADGDIRDNQGETPFDNVIEHAVQRDIFQRFGYSYYWVQNVQDDPFELLKTDPQFFFETSEIVDFIRDLYVTAQKQVLIRGRHTKRSGEWGQDKKNSSSDSKLDVITIKVGRGSKLYVFKKASFADLNTYFGALAVDCMKKYFTSQFDRAQSSIAQGAEAFFKVKFHYDINGVNVDGNSLLHTAMHYKNAQVIQWLLAGHMHYKIDCMIKNNAGKTAFDYLVPGSNGPCIAAFIDTLIHRFFNKDLDCTTEQFVLQRLLYWNSITDQGRMYYFIKALRHRPDACSFFFKKEIDVNGRYKGKSALVYAIEPWLKKSWQLVPFINKYNIRALLGHGAVVDEKMILASGGYMKKLLQQAYNMQNKEEPH